MVTGRLGTDKQPLNIFKELWNSVEQKRALRITYLDLAKFYHDKNTRASLRCLNLNPGSEHSCLNS
jgi:hypothetical protein